MREGCCSTQEVIWILSSPGAFATHLTTKQKLTHYYRVWFWQKDKGILNLTVVGDSKLIISRARHNSLPKNIHLRTILIRIQSEIKTFRAIEFFHVLRENNQDADRQANLATKQPEGTLLVNGLHHNAKIPWKVVYTPKLSIGGEIIGLFTMHDIKTIDSNWLIRKNNQRGIPPPSPETISHFRSCPISLCQWVVSPPLSLGHVADMHSHEPTLKLSSRGWSYPHLNLQFPLQCGMYRVVPSSAVIRKMISQGGVTGLRTPPICGNLIADDGKAHAWGSIHSGHGLNCASFPIWFPSRRPKIHLCSFALFYVSLVGKAQSMASRNSSQWTHRVEQLEVDLAESRNSILTL